MTEPRLLERAERLRDTILAIKLTADDPWAYTLKARGWAARAQRFVKEIAANRDGLTLEDPGGGPEGGGRG